VFGNIELKSRVILAPMAGITDLPFRRIARKFGDFLMYSEMVASQAVIRNVKRTHKMIDLDDDYFTAIQIVGADPKVMSEAAMIGFDLGAKFIDINMGCPVRKVVRSESGSALMKNEKLAAKIMEAVVESVNVPVSLKIRTGWDDKNKNSHSLAKIAEDSGIKMITVHARTRSQLFSGKANWKDVLAVKQAVKIPVIVNGDINGIQDAKEAMRESGADGIMIGRGACGSPWGLRDIHKFIETGDETEEQICSRDKMDIANLHLRYMFEFYDENTAIKLSRKVLMSYIKCMHGASGHRRSINEINTREEAFDFLKRVMDEN
jgi:tRNA-dihydrouridine synthase B